MSTFLGRLGTRLAKLGKFELGVAKIASSGTLLRADFIAPARITNFTAPRKFTAFTVPSTVTSFKSPR